MGFNTSQQAYAQAVGTTPTGGIWIDIRDPTSLDVGNPWPIGQFWLNTTTTSLWYLNNFTSTGGYVAANWVPISIAAGILETLSDTANTPVSPSSNSDVPPDNIQLINLDGSISIISDAANNRIEFSANNSGTDWEVTTTNQTLADNDGWFANSVSQLQFALPATSSVGDSYEIVAMGTGGWIITQSAGQSIVMDTLTSTVGASGSINSTAQGDWIRLVCREANLTWQATMEMGVGTVT